MPKLVRSRWRVTRCRPLSRRTMRIMPDRPMSEAEAQLVLAALPPDMLGFLDGIPSVGTARGGIIAPAARLRAPPGRSWRLGR